MVKRRDLKEAHESAVLSDFKMHLERNHTSFKILDKPEPPEAIVEINNKKTWIEITDAFLDKNHAISLTSGVSEDKVHQKDDDRLIHDPDKKFRIQLLEVITKKYNKDTMIQLSHKLGPGILLIGVFTPFNTAKGILKEEKETIESLISTESHNIFTDIYVYDGTGGNREFHKIFQIN